MQERSQSYVAEGSEEGRVELGRARRGTMGGRQLGSAVCFLSYRMGGTNPRLEDPGSEVGSSSYATTLPSAADSSMAHNGCLSLSPRCLSREGRGTLTECGCRRRVAEGVVWSGACPRPFPVSSLQVNAIVGRDRRESDHARDQGSKAGLEGWRGSGRRGS